MWKGFSTFELGLFAGLPIARWAFGFRVWTAMLLALYVAFWLELDGASSAATCVAILSLPTRGQAFEKAFYRSLATIVGVATSIAISGLFPQTRELFISAYAGWLGLCVFFASLFDGSRAYGFVPSGYTVAIVSVLDIDAPMRVWSSGINRGAAIAVGIASVAFVSDVMAAPNLFAKVVQGVGGARRKALDLARQATALQYSTIDDSEVVVALETVMALHPQVSALATESLLGRRRASSARHALLAIVHEMILARAIVRHADPVQGSPISPDDLGSREAASRTRARLARAALTAPVDAAVSLYAGAALADADWHASAGLEDLASSQAPQQRTRLPLFRCRRYAADRAARIGFAVALSSIPLIYSSWPQTSTTLSLLGILAALGATTPNVHAFALGALISLPLSMVLTGINEFIILDGVDAFPLLAITLLPLVMSACLMMSSANKKTAGVGFLLLVFIPVFLSPANPQPYNPLTFLVFSMTAFLAVLVFCVLLAVVPGTSDAKRRRWLLRSAVDDLRITVRGKSSRLTPSESAYRAADRITQIAALTGSGAPERDAALSEAFWLADVDSALRRAHSAMADFGGTPTETTARCRGLPLTIRMDPCALRGAAAQVEGAPGGVHLANNLYFAANVVEKHLAHDGFRGDGLAPGWCWRYRPGRSLRSRLSLVWLIRRGAFFLLSVVPWHRPIRSISRL